MSARTLDVFSLRDAVVGEYEKFATSFTTIRADDIRQRLDAIYAQGRYWPEPLLQVNPSYLKTTTVEKLAAAGALVPECARIFRAPSKDRRDGESLELYKHQEQAIAFGAAGASYVVTTGTGSGKSLCFFIPIVDAVVKERRLGGPPRTRAIVIYPMNALANSQQEELEKYLSNVPGEKPVTFARYTGQESGEERDAIAANPPDILLTNFMMLELIMTRQDERDRKVIANCAGLRFLVLDELHTYRGRQGADVALLVRRVRERLAPERLQCVGTSATMSSGGSAEEKARVIARVASKLFATAIPESNVIGETLARVTNADLRAEAARDRLGPSIDAGISLKISDAELREHPLAIWVETTLGMRWSDTDLRWERARPLEVSEAVKRLASEAARPEPPCRDALRDLLLASSVPESGRTGRADASDRSFFAFKLHQFVSGANHAYATLEPKDERTITVEAQQFAPGAPEKRLYPVHFCRECGQEYHPVRLVTGGEGQRVLARDIDDAPLERPAQDANGPAADGATDGATFGFLTPHGTDDPLDFNGTDGDYPDAWVESAPNGEPRLKAYYRPLRAREVRVAPDGAVSDGIRAWFLPGKFRVCLRCKNTFGSGGRDRNRLASLSAEGRSSATTVLVASALRWMHQGDSGLELPKRKILGFTDNRQDAALQAGHFNDFVFVSLVRAGLLAALEDAGDAGLRSSEFGAAHQRALGFVGANAELRPEWLLDPAVKGVNLLDAEATLREVLAYRVWFDQRRGWRYTNPNLEQLRLVHTEYQALDALAADEAVFAKGPDCLKGASPQVRSVVFTRLLDHLRTWMAIRSKALEPTTLESVVARSHSRLRAPWGFAFDEKPASARWFMIAPPTRRETGRRDEDLIVRGGSRSALGRILRSPRLWNGDGSGRAMKAQEFDKLVEFMLGAAGEYGLVSQEPTPFDAAGWRLNDACVVFKRGPRPGEAEARPNDNKFFIDLYATLAGLLRRPGHPLFGFEAREHTAQVDKDQREARERRFRWGEKEREKLKEEEQQLLQMGEADRFLPLLFCSPTMELGVDISALNAVYLRNMPPTPANYAQRSGRAGRSGQAALVLAYCAAQSPHDQYFFRDPTAMVYGEVRPPLIDLANRDLVESHLQAVWLAATEEPLDVSIAEVLVLPDPTRPLRSEKSERMGSPRIERDATARMQRILDLLVDELTPEAAPWYPGAEQFAADVAANALARFDGAFKRWRDLFAAAETQRDAARRVLDDYRNASWADKQAAKSRHAQALDQIALLQKGTSSLSSDFYTYRYLATEGFLPGYNFPRLPLMAYVPATQEGRRQTYLQRPRFLALSEFGPRSLVYHEGRAYRVVRALLALGQGETTAETTLPTESVRICRACGAGHFSPDVSLCHSCRSPLGNAVIVKDVFRIENVATQPAERITANDEERQRQGFELQTTFEWAERGGERDFRSGTAADSTGQVARLAYGSGATITRLNKGLRRRADKAVLGFMIDPVSGYWAKNGDDDEDGDAPVDPTVRPRQRVVPCVKDRKNALLFQPAASELPPEALATTQHSLLRGIEERFQLEEGEILAEPMPSRDERGGFLLYEASEGGAGVLTRLVAEPGALAEVARSALRLMHFAVDPDKPEELPATADGLDDSGGSVCVAACYQCLMSYYNQPDHELLDRQEPAAKELLLRLARSTIALAPRIGADPSPVTAPAAGAEGRWREAATARGLPPPDSEPLRIEGASFPIVWREQYVVAALGTLDRAATATLADRGIEVVVFGDDEASWAKAFDALAAALGR